MPKHEGEKCEKLLGIASILCSKRDIAPTEIESDDICT